MILAVFLNKKRANRWLFSKKINRPWERMRSGALIWLKMPHIHQVFVFHTGRDYKKYLGFVKG
jgi:hypothetical protein